ncbi:MAG: nucleotidyltransferase domain-containing protein [Bacillus sp. (in: firmicutes)]
MLNELKEHTLDSDCAKEQHFYEETKYRIKAKFFNILKSVIFLATIATYVLIVSGVRRNRWFNDICILLVLISTLLEILSYMLRYEEKAMEHWKAAQMYSEVYRKCQFFCLMYSHCSFEVWREKLTDISEELSRISLLSPGVSLKSYKKWKKNNLNKKYPVDKAICDLKIDNIDKIIDIIKETLHEYKIEIFLFGSYLSSMYYNDIDIAVIVHEKFTNYQLEEKMNKIEKKYSIDGFNLDITIITEDDINANRCTQFIKNICEGICYYKSSEIKKSITDYVGTLCNYSEMIEYFIEHANNHRDDYRVFVSDVFYMYYHALTAFLSSQNINWYGEQSMISECERLLMNEEKLSKIDIKSTEFIDLMKHVRLFFKEKNSAYLNGNNKNTEVLARYFDVDIERVRKIVGNVGNAI